MRNTVWDLCRARYRESNRRGADFWGPGVTLMNSLDLSTEDEKFLGNGILRNVETVTHCRCLLGLVVDEIYDMLVDPSLFLHRKTSVFNPRLFNSNVELSKG